MKTKKIIILIAILLAVSGGGYFAYMKYFYPSTTTLGLQNSNNQAVQNQEVVQKQVDLIKALTQSPVAVTTRGVLDVLNSTSTKNQDEIWKKPQLVNVKKYLTKNKLDSKFIVMNGQELEGVGNQIFILFLNEPDMVFRLSYQNTGATTSPFSLVNFTKSDDKSADIAKYMQVIGPLVTQQNIGI